MQEDSKRTAEQAAEIVTLTGGKENILYAINCMTRVRITTRDNGRIDDDGLKALDYVLKVVHDRDNYVEVVVGPGKSHELVEEMRTMGIPDSLQEDADDLPAKTKKNEKFIDRVRDMLKSFGQIFAPLIPGIIAAGLCAGFAALISETVPGYQDKKGWALTYQILTGVNATFITFLTAWAGYRAAEIFDGTPILGGMLGMFTTLGNVDEISKILGLYNEAQPLNAILRAGRGGVLAAVIGVWMMCRIERFIRKRIKGALDVVFSPLLTILASLAVYVLVLMPCLGLVSTGICRGVEAVAMSTSPVVRMATGFISAMLFLPMVATGMHHGLIALYTVQLETLGYVTLYPALCMAGAGQVGAAIALAIKARKNGDRKLLRVINGALPAGILGVGEPLIYGVTMPLGRPFITAGIGAGFGGAFVMLTRVASTTWGPSGILGVFVMTEGPNGVYSSVGCYLCGLLISCAAAYVITALTVKKTQKT